MIACVAANPSIDKLFEIYKLEPGVIHRPSAFVQVPGGKGLNVARAAATLGGDVRAAALLGGHTGAWIDEALAAEGVKGVFTWTDGETRSSLSVADRQTQGLTEFYENGADISPQAWENLEDGVLELLSGAAWLTLSGSLPPGAPDDGYRRLIVAARTRGVRAALDARGAALASAIGAGPDLVKVNASEAAALIEMRVSSVDDASAAARELREMAAGNGRAAIVTIGAEGAVLAEPGGSLVRGQLEAIGPYPVGSGDAFLGGLVVALDDGGSWNEALALALGAAAANAEVPGAGRLDRKRAESLARSATVGEI